MTDDNFVATAPPTLQPAAAKKRALCASVKGRL